MPGEPAGYRTGQAAPRPGRCADDEGVRVLLGGGGGEFACRAAPAGEQMHVETGGIGRLVKLRQQPFFQVTGVLGQSDHLAGQWLAVHTRRRNVHHEQGTAQAPGHARRVGERVAAGR
jgi:hypothetical protein